MLTILFLMLYPKIIGMFVFMFHVRARYLGGVNSEAVVQRYSIKIAVLKILENFGEKTYGGTLF